MFSHSAFSVDLDATNYLNCQNIIVGTRQCFFLLTPNQPIFSLFYRINMVKFQYALWIILILGVFWIFSSIVISLLVIYCYICFRKQHSGKMQRVKGYKFFIIFKIHFHISLYFNLFQFNFCLSSFNTFFCYCVKNNCLCGDNIRFHLF